MNIDIQNVCKECKSTSFEFIERLGEQVCCNCGIVLSINPFEETTAYYNKSVGLVGTSHSSKGSPELGSVILSSDIKNRRDFSNFTMNKHSMSLSQGDIAMHRI